VIRGLNKVTAKTELIDISLDADVPFGTLLLSLKKCWHSAPDEKPEHAALLEIFERKLDGTEQDKLVFSGWMFSSSPAVSALEHPVYDITLLACKRAQ